MPSNKPRLHVALYARGTSRSLLGAGQYEQSSHGGGSRGSDEDDSYHWVLLVTPKTESPATFLAGTKHSVSNTPTHAGSHASTRWRYHTDPLSQIQEPGLLVRVTVAKVRDTSVLEKILGTIEVDKHRGFTSKTWVANALAALDQSNAALASGGKTERKTGDWKEISEIAQHYVNQKKAVGRWTTEGEWDPRLPATYSLIDGQETFP